MAYVYFIRHKGLKPVKIGFTTQKDVMKRVNTFNTYSPYGVELIGTIETLEPKEIESEIHKDLESYRLNGEWFNIDLEMVSRVVGRYPYKYCEKRRVSFDIPYKINYEDYDLNKMKIFRQFHYSFYLDQKFDFELIKKCVIKSIGMDVKMHTAKSLWNEWADIASLEKVDNPKANEKKYFYPKIKPIDFKRE